MSDETQECLYPCIYIFLFLYRRLCYERMFTEALRGISVKTSKQRKSNHTVNRYIFAHNFYHFVTISFAVIFIIVRLFFFVNNHELSDLFLWQWWHSCLADINISCCRFRFKNSVPNVFYFNEPFNLNDLNVEKIVTLEIFLKRHCLGIAFFFKFQVNVIT